MCWARPKKTVDEVSSSGNLDPEVLQRWVDYLPKDHTYPYLNDWKAMIASPESTEDDAKVLGDAFQKLVLRVRAAEPTSKSRTTSIQRQERRAQAPAARRQAQRVRHLRPVLPRLRTGVEGAARRRGQALLGALRRAVRRSGRDGSSLACWSSPDGD